MEDDFDVKLAAQLEPVKSWMRKQLTSLQAENLDLKQRLQSMGTITTGKTAGSTWDSSALDLKACPREDDFLGLAEVTQEIKASTKCAAEVPPSGITELLTTSLSTCEMEVKAENMEQPTKPVLYRQTAQKLKNAGLRQTWLVEEDGEDSDSKEAERRSYSRKVGQCLRSALDDAISKHSFPQEDIESVTSWTLPLHPHSGVRMFWDTLAAFVLLYDFIAIPLGVFELQSTALENIGYFVLTYWTLDIVMSCITSYVTRKGDIVSSWRAIWRHYAMTWLSLDIIIVGLEYFMMIVNNERNAASFGRLAKCFRAVRVVRLLRLLRLAKLREFICKVEEMIDSEYVSIIWSVIVNIFVLLMLNHCCACTWFYVGKNEESDDSWIKKYAVVHASFADQYFTSLHWSLTQFTPASMNVQPQNLRERIFAVLVLLMALVMFSTFVSSVTAGMTRLRTLQAEQISDQYKLRKFLKVHQISHDLVARVNRYIEIAMQNRKKSLPRASVKLLRYLSGPLNIELLMEICVPHLKVHPYFDTCLNSNVLGHMCHSAIEMVNTSQRDIIFSRFHKAGVFYILVCGSTAYKVRNFERSGRRTIRLTPGMWFSEGALWMDWIHQGTMQAVTETDMMQVDANKFEEVVQSQLTAMEQSRIYAKKFLEDFNESILSYGHCWDVPYAFMKKGSEMEGTKTGSDIAKAENLEAQLLSLSSSETEDEEELEQGENCNKVRIQESLAHRSQEKDKHETQKALQI